MPKGCPSGTLCGISRSFPLLSPTERQVAHALLTRPPLTRSPKGPRPFDLHVLGTPPAFVLSQDQTLNKMVSKQPRRVAQIISSSHSLSSKLLKKFRWLSLHLDKSARCFSKHQNLIIQGASHVSRCLIYKVHRPLSAVGFHLITSSSVCQELFSNSFRPLPTQSSEFPTFRTAFSPASQPAPFGAELLYFTTSPRFCQEVFS